MLTPPPPIPLTLVTGFLGAGKTTLLNRLLKDPALAETVVLVNEFGEIGLDHLMMEGVEDGMILLDSGCLCCTIRGDLIRTLEDLLRRRDNGRIAPFRRLVIETTGLADPSPILNVVIAHPYLALRYMLAGVVTLVDAVNGMATLDRHSEAVRQAIAADRILITKSELAPPGESDRLAARLAALNPGVTLIDAATQPDAATLIDAGHVSASRFDLDARPEALRRWLGEEASSRPIRAAHAHGEDCAHPPGVAQISTEAGDGDEAGGGHDPNRHDARIRAVTLRAEAPIRQSSFDMFWQLLGSMHGPKLLRLKGLVRLAEHPDEPIVIHGAQALLHPPVRLPRWPDGDQASRLVLIVDDLDPVMIERLWAAFLGGPQQAAG